MEPPLVARRWRLRLEFIEGLYGLKQAGRIWHERLKAGIGGFVIHAMPYHAVFRIGTRRNGDWAVCAFWVDDETGIGLRQLLDRVEEMSRRKYGISSEGSSTVLDIRDEGEA